MERRLGRRRSADSWRVLLGRFVGSGLTVEGYCRRESISAASFYRWRALLSGATDSAVVARSGPIAVPSRPDFVDLGTLTPPGSRLELRLDLGGGLILQIVRG
jgi:putative transposase